MTELRGDQTFPSQVPAWFERRFEFNFSVDQYPNLCVRLSDTPARLEDQFRGISRDVLVRRPSAKWSAQEHAGHLLDLESLWMARVDDLLAGRDRLTVADLTNRKTHTADHNARPLTEILEGFRTARFHLLNRLGTLRPADFARSALHPRLEQPMRLVDHLFFVAEHDDHHLATIRELIIIPRSTRGGVPAG
jgi:uncharacterized damage-inducible protein DinB